MWQVLLSGFSLGIFSSLHCVGMCGPLMLALPVRHLGRWQQLSAIVLYNSGRIITYSIIGLIIGLLGRKIVNPALQQWLSIIAGITMLLLAAAYFTGKKWLKPGWMINMHSWLLDSMSVLLQSKKIGGYFLLGAANGLLPCGMVYIAIAGALMHSGQGQSMLFMMVFGLGTLPAMLALGFFGLQIRLSMRNRVKRMMPFFVVAIAVLLILRGMNLGIPFISPAVENMRDGISCHN